MVSSEKVFFPAIKFARNQSRNVKEKKCWEFLRKSAMKIKLNNWSGLKETWEVSNWKVKKGWKSSIFLKN